MYFTYVKNMKSNCRNGNFCRNAYFATTSAHSAIRIAYIGGNINVEYIIIHRTTLLRVLLLQKMDS